MVRKRFGAVVVGAGVEGARTFVDQPLEAVVFARISGDQILEAAGVESVHTDMDHVVGAERRAGRDQDARDSREYEAPN